jgi:hypothetical protein
VKQIMKHESFHLSDQQLLTHIDGELTPQDEKQVREHLDACWKCRVRKQEIEHAIADFVRVHRDSASLPSAEGPRALLRAQMERVAQGGAPTTWSGWNAFFRDRTRLAAIAGAACLLIAALFATRAMEEAAHRSARRALMVSIPNTSLTPGAAVLTSRQAVCSQTSEKNKAVSEAIRRKVFEEYGISGAEPKAYEVDYLITPALGGADDIRNLWPHSYATVWNAHVKDELEDRLRDLVCSGGLDLSEAQHEIAANWIAAYQKYFHTERPDQ